MEKEVVRWRNSKTQFRRMPNRGARPPLLLSPLPSSVGLRNYSNKFCGQSGGFEQRVELSEIAWERQSARLPWAPLSYT